MLRRSTSCADLLALFVVSCSESDSVNYFYLGHMSQIIWSMILEGILIAYQHCQSGNVFGIL